MPNLSEAGSIDHIASISWRTDSVQVTGPDVDALRDEQLQQFAPLMKDKLAKLRLARASDVRVGGKEATASELANYSGIFLDTTVETMQEMFGWDDLQAREIKALLLEKAVQPHEEFLESQLVRYPEQMAEQASVAQHWLAQQFNKVYDAGMKSRAEGKPLSAVLPAVTSAESEERVDGKTLFLNMAGWYATEATVAFAARLTGKKETEVLETLDEIFDLSDEELQRIVQEPQDETERLQAQIVLFAVQSANLTWMQVQPYRAVVFDDFNRITPGDEKAPYFSPFLEMSKNKGWPAVLIDRDQIVQGIRIKRFLQNKRSPAAKEESTE